MYDICLLFDDVTVHFNLIGVQDSEPDTSPHSGYGWGRDYPHIGSSEYILVETTEQKRARKRAKLAATFWVFIMGVIN